MTTIDLYIGGGAWKPIQEKPRPGDYIRIQSDILMYAIVDREGAQLLPSLTAVFSDRLIDDEVKFYERNWIEFLENTSRWDLMLDLMDPIYDERFMASLILSCVETLPGDRSLKRKISIARDLIEESTSPTDIKTVASWLISFLYTRLPWDHNQVIAHMLAGTAVYILLRVGFSKLSKTSVGAKTAYVMSRRIAELSREMPLTPEDNQRMADCLRAKIDFMDIAGDWAGMHGTVKIRV